MCVRFRARRNAGQELPNASRKGYKQSHGQFRLSFLIMADSIFSQVTQISQAVANCKEIHVILLNYCKNGTPFWNLLHLSPVLDVDKRLVSFVGSQVNVSAAVSLLLISCQSVDKCIMHRLEPRNNRFLCLQREQLLSLKEAEVSVNSMN